MTQTSSASDVATPERAATERAEAFVAALPEVTDRPNRHDSYARAGMSLMILGFVSAVIATIMSQVSDNPLDQSTQISLGLAGVAAVGLGGVIFLRYSLGQLLRFWLLHRADSRQH